MPSNNPSDSWGRSLRDDELTDSDSEAPPPTRLLPPRTPQDALIAAAEEEDDGLGSVWGNSRSDPIDIGLVPEPIIAFKETPFTIARRVGAAASKGIGSGSGGSSKKPPPAPPRKPAPAPAAKKPSELSTIKPKPKPKPKLPAVKPAPKPAPSVSSVSTTASRSPAQPAMINEAPQIVSSRSLVDTQKRNAPAGLDEPAPDPVARSELLPPGLSSAKAGLAKFKAPATPKSAANPAELFRSQPEAGRSRPLGDAAKEVDRDDEEASSAAESIFTSQPPSAVRVHQSQPQPSQVALGTKRSQQITPQKLISHFKLAPPLKQPLPSQAGTTSSHSALERFRNPKSFVAPPQAPYMPPQPSPSPPERSRQPWPCPEQPAASSQHLPQPSVSSSTFKPDHAPQLNSAPKPTFASTPRFALPGLAPRPSGGSGPSRLSFKPSESLSAFQQRKGLSTLSAEAGPPSSKRRRTNSIEAGGREKVVLGASIRRTKLLQKLLYPALNQPLHLTGQSTSVMQLLDLPTELLVHIVRLSVADLDLELSARSKALSSYSHVCSALRGVAQAELARDIRIDHPSQLPSFLAFAAAIPVTKVKLHIQLGALQGRDVEIVLASCPALVRLEVIYSLFHHLVELHLDSTHVVPEDAMLNQLDIFFVNPGAWDRLPAPLLKKHADKILLCVPPHTRLTSLSLHRDPDITVHLLLCDGTPPAVIGPLRKVAFLKLQVDHFLQSVRPQLATLYLPPCLRETPGCDPPSWTTFRDKIEFADGPGAHGEPLLSHPFAKRCIAAKAQRASEG
ncbi:hypothetical protein JCM5296_005385 [Sporobolomyces johnsonii]